MNTRFIALLTPITAAIGGGLLMRHYRGDLVPGLLLLALAMGTQWWLFVRRSS
jgi:hypothetical protein